MNVLIVEDEKALASELEIFLTGNNYLCETCYNVQLASEKIATSLYDFILIDLGLPDYDGLDLLKEKSVATPKRPALSLPPVPR
jgi:DNA-binding response OmpR family regulator